MDANDVSTQAGRSTDPYATVRVGDVERRAAIAALGDQWRAGRLDPPEHEKRTTAAYHAVTRADLDALFADLPSLTPLTPLPTTTATTTPLDAAPAPPAGPGPSTSPLPPSPAPASDVAPPATRSWLDRRRDTVTGVAPFAATGLFLLTHHWEWYLGIPALGALLYSGDRHQGRDRRRDRRRDGRYG